MTTDRDSATKGRGTPADAELAAAISKGTEAWSGVPDGWVDELRGGAVEPAGAVSDVAQKIAERVPLPGTPIYMLAVDGVHTHFTDGSGLPAEKMVESVCIYRPGAECDVTRLYTAAQMEALRLAVAEEALRGAEAARVRIYFPGIGIAGPFDVADGEVSLPDITMSELARHFRMGYVHTPPRASVEVTEEMVERAVSAYNASGHDFGVLPADSESMRAALTAALQEPEA